MDPITSSWLTNSSTGTTKIGPYTLAKNVYIDDKERENYENSVAKKIVDIEKSVEQVSGAVTIANKAASDANTALGEAQKAATAAEAAKTSAEQAVSPTINGMSASNGAITLPLLKTSGGVTMVLDDNKQLKIKYAGGEASVYTTLNGPSVPGSVENANYATTAGTAASAATATKADTATSASKISPSGSSTYELSVGSTGVTLKGADPKIIVTKSGSTSTYDLSKIGKINTSSQIGSATQPVYISSTGVPQSIGKDVVLKDNFLSYFKACFNAMVTYNSQDGTVTIDPTVSSVTLP